MEPPRIVFNNVQRNSSLHKAADYSQLYGGEGRESPLSVILNSKEWPNQVKKDKYRNYGEPIFLSRLVLYESFFPNTFI